uniref:Uncharacterized protein n=1 Tax=Anguilla anguilla TaxID=7936 RepID=A0A0E9TEG9_ANGAN
MSALHLTERWRRSDAKPTSLLFWTHCS